MEFKLNVGKFVNDAVNYNLISPQDSSGLRKELEIHPRVTHLFPTAAQVKTLQKEFDIKGIGKKILHIQKPSIDSIYRKEVGCTRDELKAHNGRELSAYKSKLAWTLIGIGSAGSAFLELLPKKRNLTYSLVVSASLIAGYCVNQYHKRKTDTALQNSKQAQQYQAIGEPPWGKPHGIT